MAANKDNETLRDRSGTLVDELARTVISQMNGTPLHSSNRRLEAGTSLLLTAALDREPFELERVCADLDALRVSDTDVLDHCIPAAARALGTDWLQDKLSFANVSTASARLFGLCKEVGADWHNFGSDPSTCSVLLATIGREDHLVGPAVLTERLRRAGHSVYTLLNTDALAVVQRLRDVGHDAIMISAGSFRTLETANEAIKTIKSAGVKAPIMLGGAILDLDNEIEKTSSADLVTSNIDTALATLARLGVRSLGAG